MSNEKKTSTELVTEFVRAWCVKSASSRPTINAVARRDWTPKGVLYAEYCAWCAGRRHYKHGSALEFKVILEHLGHRIFRTHHGDFFDVRLTGLVAWVEPADVEDVDVATYAAARDKRLADMIARSRAMSAGHSVGKE
jgi:hypothetical protein